MNFMFPYIGNNNPNWWTHIFQRGWNHQPETGWWYWKRLGNPMKNGGFYDFFYGKIIYKFIIPRCETMVLEYAHLQNCAISGWWWLEPWNGLWLSIQLGMSSSQLTNSYFYIFFREVGIPPARKKTYIYIWCFKICLIIQSRGLSNSTIWSTNSLLWKTIIKNNR